MSQRRYTLGAWYRTAEGRNYAFRDVTLPDRDEAMRLYRTMRDNPARFGVPRDVLMYVVGPVVAEEKVRDSRSWRYAGTPAASHVVIDRYEEWRPSPPDTSAPAPEPAQPTLGD